MSKALVIKGASFALNKVETITIVEPIPCTNLELSDGSHSFTAIGATKTLTVTKTPADTTDVLTWESSNENVATVSDGVVTCVGVGSATITATCGEQTATCSVTSSITVNVASAYSYIDGKSTSGTDLANSKDYVSVYTGAKYRAYYSETATTAGYHLYSYIEDTTYPIMLPNNTKTITITNASINQARIVLTKSTEQCTYSITRRGAKALSNQISMTQSGTSFTADISSYSGYDSIAFDIRSSGSASSDITGDITIVYS